MTSSLANQTLRRHLLATAALAGIALAGGANAQHNTGSASGVRTLENQQNSQAATILADASDMGVTGATGQVESISVTLAGNLFSSTARANSATLAIAAPAIDDPVAAMPTSVAVGQTGAEATAANVIANRQGMTRTDVAADLYRASTGIVTGLVGAGSLTVSRNEEDASAKGNDVASGISLGARSGGAGITSMQSVLEDSNGLRPLSETR